MTTRMSEEQRRAVERIAGRAEELARQLRTEWCDVEAPPHPAFS
jgi:hypothetical protein